MKKIILALFVFIVTLHAEQLELRLGATSGSGDLTISVDGLSSGAVSGSYSGYKLQYGTLIEDGQDSSFIYFGFESIGLTSSGATAEDKMTSFVLGSEGITGEDKAKFVYGGEFGFGNYDVAGLDLSFSTFSAEPYVGLRYDFNNNLAFNSRLGLKAIRLLETDYFGSKVSGVITGIGYIFGISYKY